MLSRRGLLILQRCRKFTIGQNQWKPITIHCQVRMNSTDSTQDVGNSTSNVGDGSVQGSNTESIEQSGKGATHQKRPIIRTLFYVPGSSQKMIDKAWTLTPDNITLDLEDSVSQSEKGAALTRVVETLAKFPKHPTAEVAVRINVNWLHLDISELAALSEVSSAIDAIVIPKSSTMRNGTTFHHMLHYISENCKPYNLWLLTETPTGIQFASQNLSPSRLSPLLRSSRFKIRGLIFGAEDYAKTMGITRSKSLIELLYARQSLVSAAKSNRLKLEVIDLVSTDFRDLDVLREECRNGASFGFTGKQAIHPDQIPVIHEAFSPSKESIEYSARLLRKFVEEGSEGRRGSWEFEGKMVDKPVIDNARRIINMAVALDVEKSTALPIQQLLESSWPLRIKGRDTPLEEQNI